MPDLEKVIRGLTVCSEFTPVQDCQKCPYQGEEYCTDAVMLDALALLREQETEYKPDGPDFFDGRTHIRWKCTSCQYFVCTEKGTTNMKYCPNCGRKVSGDADD